MLTRSNPVSNQRWLKHLIASALLAKALIAVPGHALPFASGDPFQADKAAQKTAAAGPSPAPGAFDSQGVLVPSLSVINPRSILYSPSGEIFMIDSGAPATIATWRLLATSTSTGKTRIVIDGLSQISSGLNQMLIALPGQLALGPRGDIFAIIAGSIYRITPSTATMRKIAMTPQTEARSHLNVAGKMIDAMTHYFTSVAVDSAGNVFGFHSDGIVKWEAATGKVSLLVAWPDQTARFQTANLAVNPAGDVAYVDIATAQDPESLRAISATNPSPTKIVDDIYKYTVGRFDASEGVFLNADAQGNFYLVLDGYAYKAPAKGATLRRITPIARGPVTIDPSGNLYCFTEGHFQRYLTANR